MPIFRKKRKNDASNIMEMIPIPQCQTEVNKKDGTIDLLMPRFKSNRLSKLIPPKKDPHIFIHLDELGTAFWKKVDGKSTVYEIGKMMMSEIPEKMENGLERVGLFAQMLYRQEFIILQKRQNGKG